MIKHKSGFNFASVGTRALQFIALYGNHPENRKAAAKQDILNLKNTIRGD